jgi:hypothetical protein
MSRPCTPCMLTTLPRAPAASHASLELLSVIFTLQPPEPQLLEPQRLGTRPCRPCCSLSSLVASELCMHGAPLCRTHGCSRNRLLQPAAEMTMWLCPQAHCYLGPRTHVGMSNSSIGNQHSTRYCLPILLLPAHLTHSDPRTNRALPPAHLPALLHSRCTRAWGGLA